MFYITRKANYPFTSKFIIMKYPVKQFVLLQSSLLFSGFSKTSGQRFKSLNLTSINQSGEDGNLNTESSIAQEKLSNFQNKSLKVEHQTNSTPKRSCRNKDPSITANLFCKIWALLVSWIPISHALSPCRDFTHYPKTFGGFSNSSLFNVYASDVFGNFAVGGQTSDSNIISSLTGPHPIIEYYHVSWESQELDTTDWLMWSKYFVCDTPLTALDCITLNPLGDKLAVMFSNSLGAHQKLAILDTATGTFINKYNYTGLGPSSKIFLGNPQSLLLDNLGKLYVHLVDDSNSWNLALFANAGVYGQALNDGLMVKANYPSLACSRMDSMLLQPSQNSTVGSLGVYVWGRLLDSQNNCQYHLVYISSNNGASQWIVNRVNHSAETVIKSNHLMDIGGDQRFMWSCGYHIVNNQQKALFIRTKLNRTNPSQVPLNSELIIYELSTSNTQSMSLSMSDEKNGYALISFGGEDFRTLKISTDTSLSPLIGTLYTFNYGGVFESRFNSGVTLGIFTRAAKDEVFIQLGYFDPYYYDPITDQQIHQRHAFMRAQSYMGSSVSSFCDFNYTVTQQDQIENLLPLSTNEFQISIWGLQLFKGAISSTMGLDSTILSFDVIQDQNLLRWYCSSPPIQGYLTLNQTQLDLLEQDIARNTTTMTRLLDEKTVTLPSGVCLANLTYTCVSGCGASLQLDSSQNLVRVFPLQQINIDVVKSGLQTTNVTIRGTVYNSPSLIQVYQDLKLEVQVYCLCTGANIIDPYSGSPTTLPYQKLPSYTLGQPRQVMHIDPIQSNASCCTVQQVQLQQMAAALPPIWALNITSMDLSVEETANKSYAQIWDFNLTYEFGNDVQLINYSRYFSQEIVYSCAAATIVSPQELYALQSTYSWVYDLERGNIDTFDLQWNSDNETACLVCSQKFSFSPPTFLSMNSGQIILQSDPTDITLISNWTGFEGPVGYQGQICSLTGVAFANTVKFDQISIRLMSCFKSLIFSQTVDYFVRDYQKEFKFYNNSAPLSTDCGGVEFTLLDIKDRDGTSYYPNLDPTLPYNNPFTFSEQARFIGVQTDDLFFSSPTINPFTAIIKGSYNRGLSNYENITMTININHSCLHSVTINNSLPYFGNLSSSQTWYHDVSQVEPTVIKLTWSTSNELICGIGEYQFSPSISLQGASISIANQTDILIQTTPQSASNLDLVSAPPSNIRYEGYMIGLDESIKFGLPIGSSSLKIEFIDCLQYLQLDNNEVVYFINDDAIVDNYFISSQTTRQYACPGILFELAAQDAIGQMVLTNALNVSLSSIEKRVSLSSNDTTLAASPNQPFTITLSGQYPDQTRSFPSLNFKLTFKDPCIEKVVFGENEEIVMGDQTYILMDSSLNLLLTFYKANLMYSHCGASTNEIWITNSRMLAISHVQMSSLFYYSPQTQTLSIESSNQTDVLLQPYKVSVKSFNANYPNNFKEYSFLVYVKCQTHDLLPTNDNLDSLFTTDAYHYFIKDPPLRIPISQFKPVQECGLANAITYATDFYLSEIKLTELPNFVTIDSTDSSVMLITIFSENRSDMTTYPQFSLHIIGKVLDMLSGAYVYGTMKIPVILMVQNYGDPYLASDLTDIEIEINVPLTFKLPDIKDPDQDDSPSLYPNYPIFDQAIDLYKQGSYPLYTFIVKDPKLGGKSFSVSIKLTDNNPYQPKFSEYLFYLKVKALAIPDKDYSQEPIEDFDDVFTPKTNTTLSRVPQPGASLSTLPLSVKISSVSQTGLVKLTFNQDIILPDMNLTYINQHGLFSSIKVICEEDQIIRNLTGYTVESIEAREIEVQLSFGQPLSISSGFGYDKLYIEFSKKLVISALANPNITLSKNLQLQNSVPPQLHSKGAAEKLDTSTKATSNGLIMIICANLGLTLVGGFSMKKLWQLISTLQIIVHYPLMNLPMQSNVVMVLKGIQDISNLNIIPKDTIKAFLNKIMKDTSDGVSGQFQSMGYDSSNTMHNMGLAAIIVVQVIMLILILALAGRASKRSPRVQRLISSLKSKLMFNPLIQAQLKGYIKFNLSVLLSLQKVDDPLALAINGMLAIYLVSSPCLFLRYLTKRNSSSQLDERTTKQRYGSFYMNLKTSSLQTLAYTVLYLYRRLLFALSIIVLSGNPLAQIVFAMGLSFFMLVYLLHYRPHRSLNTRFFEVFNECNILAITYMVIINAELVTDDLLRYNIGWTIVGIIGLIVLANLANVFANMGKKVFLKIKDFLAKRSINRAKIYQAKSQIKVREESKKCSLEINQAQIDLCSNVADNGQGYESRMTQQTSNANQNGSMIERQSAIYKQADPASIHLTSIRRNKILEEQERMVAFTSKIVNVEDSSIQKQKSNVEKRYKRLSKIQEIDKEVQRMAYNTKLENI